MSFVKIYVHTVWATKDRLPYLSDHYRETIINRIRDYAKSKGIYIDHINVVKEHMHSLISMSAEQNIATFKDLMN